MSKRLYRSTTNKMIAGVCGGIAEYFDTDPTIIRLLCVLLAVLSGGFLGVFGYLVAAVVIPVKGSEENNG